MEKARLGLDYKIANKIICSLKGGYTLKDSEKEDYFWYFKSVLT